MTTNNHPAHGPVSLDRLQQIRETLSKAVAQRKGVVSLHVIAKKRKCSDGKIRTQPQSVMGFFDGGLSIIYCYSYG